MSSIWCLLLLGLCAHFGACQEKIPCIQRHPITRHVQQVLLCRKGCCGKELERQVCCEEFDKEKTYTQYDPETGWSPVQIFLVVMAILVGASLTLALIFCVIKCVDSSPRGMFWWL